MDVMIFFTTSWKKYVCNFLRDTQCCRIFRKARIQCRNHKYKLAPNDVSRRLYYFCIIICFTSHDTGFILIVIVRWLRRILSRYKSDHEIRSITSWSCSKPQKLIAIVDRDYAKSILIRVPDLCKDHQKYYYI